MKQKISLLLLVICLSSCNQTNQQEVSETTSEKTISEISDTKTSDTKTFNTNLSNTLSIDFASLYNTEDTLYNSTNPEILKYIDTLIKNSKKINKAEFDEMSFFDLPLATIKYNDDEINLYIEETEHIASFIYKDEYYIPNFDDVRLLISLTVYKPENTNMNADDLEFAKSKNFTPIYLISEQNLKLPDTFDYNPGDFPDKLYFSQYNELSKSTGLDFSSYLGKDVTVSTYYIYEGIDFNHFFNINLSLALIKHENKIVGAFLVNGEELSFGFNLDIKDFYDVYQIMFADWYILNHFKYNNAFVKEDLNLSSKDILTNYLNCLPDKNGAKTRYENVNMLTEYLLLDKPTKALYNNKFHEGNDDSFDINKVEILSMEPYTPAEQLLEGQIESYKVSYKINDDKINEYIYHLKKYDTVGYKIEHFEIVKN